MKTLDEISSCPVANWEFWSQRARLSLVGYRSQINQFGSDNGVTKLSKSGFLANMRSRRNQKYLDA